MEVIQYSVELNFTISDFCIHGTVLAPCTVQSFTVPYLNLHCQPFRHVLVTPHFPLSPTTLDDAEYQTHFNS